MECAKYINENLESYKEIFPFASSLKLPTNILNIKMCK